MVNFSAQLDDESAEAVSLNTSNAAPQSTLARRTIDINVRENRVLLVIVPDSFTPWAPKLVHHHASCKHLKERAITLANFAGRWVSQF